MDLFAALLVIVPVTAVAVGAAFVLKLKGNKASIIAEAARARAFDRASERQFQDTAPIDEDPFSNGIDFSKESNTSDFGKADLDDVQKEVIALIMNGYAAPITKESVKLRGSSAHSCAGVPVSQSVFSDIEEIDLDTSWMARGRE